MKMFYWHTIGELNDGLEEEMLPAFRNTFINEFKLVSLHNEDPSEFFIRYAHYFTIGTFSVDDCRLSWDRERFYYVMQSFPPFGCLDIAEVEIQYQPPWTFDDAFITHCRDNAILTMYITSRDETALAVTETGVLEYIFGGLEDHETKPRSINLLHQVAFSPTFVRKLVEVVSIT